MNNKLKKGYFRLFSNSFLHNIHYIDKCAGFDAVMYCICSRKRGFLQIGDEIYELDHYAVQPENGNYRWSAIVWGEIPKNIINKDLLNAEIEYTYF